MTPLAKKLLACIGDEKRPTLPSFDELWMIGLRSESSGPELRDAVHSLFIGGYVVRSDTAETYAVTRRGMRALKRMSAQGGK